MLNYHPYYYCFWYTINPVNCKTNEKCGKGFAVVASEVKKLVERSRKAADEVIELAKYSFI